MSRSSYIQMNYDRINGYHCDKVTLDGIANRICDLLEEGKKMFEIEEELKKDYSDFAIQKAKRRNKEKIEESKIKAKKKKNATKLEFMKIMLHYGRISEEEFEHWIITNASKG